MTENNNHEQELAARQAEAKATPCSNCGQPMTGEYCSACGQSRRHFLRFFPAVIGDFIAETFEIDGRLSRTLKTLLFYPGKLTTAYIAGRRVHYSPPVRFYLFTSLLAFLLISIEADRNINFNIDDDEIEVSTEHNQPMAGSQQAATDNDAKPDQQPSSDDAVSADADELADAADTPNVPMASSDTQDDDELTFFGGQPWHPQHNPLHIGFLPDQANALLNQRTARIKANIPRIKENPGLLMDQFLRYLPQTLLVLLPVFALILKLFYPFTRRYYTEHVIFSIHMHSFSLLVVIIALLLNELEDITTRSWLDAGLNGLSVITLLWVPVYALLAQKRVYQQGWTATVIKFTLVYGLYSSVQMLALVFIFLLGASSL